MAFSINPASSSSNTISCPNGKKSLFLLKKITELTKLGCKALNDNVLNSTAGDLINTYLTLPQQNSDSIKKELQGLKLVLPALTSYSLKKVFHAALSEITGIDYSLLAKTQETHLNRIYTEQFLTWLQEEIDHLPDSSILLLLSIYHSFSDPSIGLETGTWQELLFLKGWNASQTKSLNQFKSKYESLNFPFIKIENTILSAEATGDIKKLKGLYRLWSRVVKILINHLDEDPKKCFVISLNKNKKFLRKKRNTPDKEFIIHAKKMIASFLPKLEQARKEYNEKISNKSITLKLFQSFLEGAEKIIQNIQEGIESDLQNSLKEINNQIQTIQKSKNEGEYYLGKLEELKRSKPPFNVMKEMGEDINIEEKKMKELRSSIKKKDQNLQTLSQLKKEVVEKLQNPQRQERLSVLRANNPDKKNIDLLEKKEIHNTLREKSLSAILFLSQWLVNLLDKEDQLINQLEQEKLIAYTADMKQIEDSFKEHSISFSKKSLAKSNSLVGDFSITSENTRGEESEEELSISSFSESSNSILGEVNSFNEINRYLTQLKEGKNTQINGFLSQAVDSLLRPLKAHLLKTKAADDLNDLYKLQTKEIYDHLLLGTAGLELATQAVHEQRTDHIVLGFRVALLHCYYAIEQKLSQKITLETNKMLDKVDQDHNLLHLAQIAKISNVEKWEQFLQEMTLHLSFSYPEDYRLFFQQRNEQRAFSLLDDLSSPNLDKKKIEEALELCFEMYRKSIVFIIEVSSTQIEDQSKFLHVIQELKKQIVSTLSEPSAKKILLAQSVVQLKEPDPVLIKVQKCLNVLRPVLKDLNSLSPCVGKREQKVYAAIGTVQSYLKFMEISLEIPLNSNPHSLQKFIRVETVVNIDKLFKHLFRAVILLRNGEDNHQHTLTNLFTSVADFYQRGDEQAIHSRLKEINLGISHHYLHIAWNNSKLHSIYNESLTQAYSLLNVSDEFIVYSTALEKRHYR